MNVYCYKGIKKFSFHNLGFFGYGRHGKSMKICGHYTVYLKGKKFLTWKHGDFYSLVGIRELPLKYLSINTSERKYLNDLIYRHMSSSLSHKVDIENYFNIYEDYIKEMEKLPSPTTHPHLWSKYENKYIAPSICFGDTVRDTSSGKVFVVGNYSDIRCLNEDEDAYKLISKGA